MPFELWQICSCIGKGFAVAEFKVSAAFSLLRVLSRLSFQAVLSVLVRNYDFELPNGPKTKFCHDVAVVSRPTVEGLPRTTVPLRIRRVEQD
jgi:hypothetical protein